MDWSKCIICGTGDGALKCPATQQDGKGSQAYEEFMKNVHGFKELKSLPARICFGDDVTTNDLNVNCAKWHKNCHLLFAKSKLLRAQERNARKRIVDHSGDDVSTGQRKSKRVSRSDEVMGCNMCIFCKKSDGILHKCETLELDKTLREQATELQDTDLLATIADGDLVAIEAKYHKQCMDAFRVRYRSYKRSMATLSDTTDQSMTDSRVFVEMISYIEANVEDGEYIFPLVDLHKMCVARFAALGYEKQVNKTRLKNKLLNHYKDQCQEQSVGKQTVLVFNEGLQKLIKEELKSRDFEKDALSMVHIAKLIRQEISKTKFCTFSGSFTTDCQDDSVPNSLKVLISMLLYGSNIKDQTATNSQECLTICQLIRFNCKDQPKVAENPRHHRSKEPPLPLYVGLSVHTQTRSKKMLTHLHKLGISVSYERVLEVEDWLTNAVCERYQEEGMVCPVQLIDGVFTAGALDNLDHNPTSQTAEGSFHGTSISVFQFPAENKQETSREPIKIPPQAHIRNPSLPDSYRIVPAIACNTDTVNVTEAAAMEDPDPEPVLCEAIYKENQWLEERIPVAQKNKLEKGDIMAWASHHSAREGEVTDIPGTSVLLPLFYEKAASMAMVKHGMEVLKKITTLRNPGQIPVIAVDQPLFALAKYAQWNWSETLGESEYVVVLGGLHTEMALWRMVGDLLEESGWCTALTESGVATAGTADSFLKAAHLTRTRHAHQVTAMTLAKLQRDSFHEMCPERSIHFEDWRTDMTQNSPTFAFWDRILQLELLVLIFVRSHREKNFALYVEVLEALAPWFFVLDRMNYSRWLPVHIKDMKTLPPSIRAEFKKNWVFLKGRRPFSAMPLDQAHEQNNEKVKHSGGAIGLTTNPAALKRWMIAGPEQARILDEFEEMNNLSEEPSFQSHEQGHAIQETFHKQVNNMCDVIKSMGNPFLNTAKELIVLDTHDCMDEQVVEALYGMEQLGKEQYSRYVSDVLVKREKSIHSTIKKNKLPLFKRPHTSTPSRNVTQLQEIKSDYNLFSQLFIATQVRDTNLEEFFSHENHPWPPALSLNGKLRLPGNKSELLACIDPSIQPEPPSHFDAKIFDGAAMVHILPHEHKCTFGEYSDKIFIPWTERQLQSSTRIDIVWDRYHPDSLKATTREKRGKGVRRKVSRNAKLPASFAGFLQNDRNKEELFALLSGEVANHVYPPEKWVYITSGERVLSNQPGCTMDKCDHEEADSRISLHVYDALRKGATSVLVRTVDTDVVVVLVGVYHRFVSWYPDLDLWVGFGAGRHFRYYHINSVCLELGEDKCQALPFFHAFTGCDVTSQFNGKGKKSAWKTWKSLPISTEGFTTASSSPFVPLETSSPVFRLIEQFTCAMYDNTTHHSKVNYLRQDLFPNRVKLMERLPPTQNALLQHVNRCVYQASIWTESLKPVIAAPSPAGFGWSKSDTGWHPIWTTIPAAAACKELIKCGCKAVPMCVKNCKCEKAGLTCTTLCQCRGDCET